MTDEPFDIQVNGYAGVNFNADGLTVQQVHAACQRLEADGVAGILATVTTAPLEAMERRLRTLVAVRRQDELVRRMIPGLHIEGPFISPEPGYRGAHPEEHIRPPDVDAALRLLDAADGLVRLFSLAPEREGDLRLTRTLVQRGVAVAAAHCNPDVDTLRAAADAGLSVFTHLGNGCPAELPRHDNIVQRALSLRERLWLCFIADGVHIPFFALGNYLRAAGLERTVVVSDAVFPAGLGPGTYTVRGKQVRVGEDLAIRAPDGPHLMGSAVTMRRQVENLRTHLGLDAAAVRRLTAENPRRAVGLERPADRS